MSRDARETKMHYSPSEKDGVFVVEVARGADSSMNYHRSEQILQPQNLTDLHLLTNIVETKSVLDNGLPNGILRSDTNQQVQIHEPPANIKSDPSLEREGRRMPPQKCSTGLSQSDLSLSSSNDSNHNYTYGIQAPYAIDTKGYKASSPKQLPLLPVSVSENELKILNRPPFVTGMIYKQDTIDIEPRLQSDIDLVTSERERLCNGVVNGDKEQEHIGQMNGTTAENNCDSIVDLPAPPSTEEIEGTLKTEMNGETNLDSLPPPPLDELDTKVLLENGIARS